MFTKIFCIWKIIFESYFRKKRILMLTFDFRLQNCQNFVPYFSETFPALQESWLRACLPVIINLFYGPVTTHALGYVRWLTMSHRQIGNNREGTLSVFLTSHLSKVEIFSNCYKMGKNNQFLQYFIFFCWWEPTYFFFKRLNIFAKFDLSLQILESFILKTLRIKKLWGLKSGEWDKFD